MQITDISLLLLLFVFFEADIMVGMTVEPKGGQAWTSSNPMIKYMLKQREHHALNQKQDYSHVFRKRTKFEMFRLAAIAMAIEFAYAAETSFVSPILLQIGIDHKHMTMAWGLSPLIGFFVSPLLGSISDRCHLNWGRRRPIISLLSFGILCGLILVPFGKDLGILLGDDSFNATSTLMQNNFSAQDISAIALKSSTSSSTSPSHKFAVALTILGMVLLDFDADTCQTPARTYLLDMCIPEDQSKALTMFTLFAGVGGTIGYAIGGIDWETTQIGSFLGGNVPTVFGLVTIIFITNSLEQHSSNDYQKYTNTYMQSYQNGHATGFPEKRDTELLADDECDKPVSLGQYLKSIFIMPNSMKILSLTNLLCWMGHVAYCLYFTDFVGEAAEPHSESFKVYEAGVRFGCWGLSIYALSCSLYSLSVTKLMAWIGTKAVYIIGILYYGVGMLILGIWPTKWGVLVFSTSAGILYGTLFTMPYILVANYHAKNCFRIHNGEAVPLKQVRGLGTDVAIISSMVFIAQLIVSLCMGPIISWMQTTCAILYASAFLAFIAAISAMFVLYV
uniref:Major facilitator superfamily (MFS) profile domain-containing protein n=1 Tax=Glossina brevipalpis TaxID=37001 RepID=A0A1A9W8E2_9MUSC